MEITSSTDGNLRQISWDLPDQGWEDVAGELDRFLAAAIQGIAEEYAAEPVAWLEINHWGDSGRLIVFPAQDGPYGNRDERILYDLNSAYLETEFARIAKSLTGNERLLAWKELEDKVWERVRESLCHGEASRSLADARRVYRFRLAAFDYTFEEGRFRLADLDEEAAVQMQKELARFKRDTA
jgi:hypothetical protein